MTNKISREKLQQIMDQLHEELKTDFAKSLQDIYGEPKHVPMEEFIHDILPKMVSTAWFEATKHADYLIVDVLKELDMLSDDK